MKRTVLVLLILALLCCAPAALANSWGLKGELLDLVSDTDQWNDYTTLCDQSGDMAVMKSRYHHVLMSAGKDGLETYTKAVYQPDADGAAGRPELVDRKGVVFPMICHDRRYTTLLNSVPLYLGDKSLPPFDFVTLYFTTEDRKTCQQVYEGYRKGAAPWFDRTSGLAFRTLL